MTIETVKVKPWGEGQGDHVIINKCDFNPKMHVLLDAADLQPKKTREALERSLSALPGHHKDPDYVVNSMRSYFGDLFTDADEAKVREVVKPEGEPDDLPSGLTVAQLKEALDAKNIEYPSTAKKADLQKLLDGSA